jgi:hypothetical protein
MLQELIEGAKRNPIWFGSIGAVTVVQGWLGWEFWGALSDAPAEQAGLRAIGLSFVGAEVVALDMARRASVHNEMTRANTLRAMWAALALLNLAVDVNALSRVLQTSEATRADEAAVLQAKKARVAELRTLIDQADDPFPDGRLLPVESYDAALRSKDREIELAAKAALWRQRGLERERGELETGREAARQVAVWRTELDGLTEIASSVSPPPRTGAIEFAPLAQALTGVAQGAERLAGQRPNTVISAEHVRAGTAVAASIAMKILLTFGIWAGLGRTRPPIASPGKKSGEPGREIQPAAASEPLPLRPSRRANVPVVRFGRFGRRRL